MRKVKKEWLLPIACVLGSVVLYGALRLFRSPAGVVSPEGQIRRESYGGDEREYTLLVEGLEAEAVPVTVSVSPRKYTQDEAQRVFYEVMDGIEERIRAENASLMEVTSELSLPSRVDEKGIRLRWRSSDPELLSSEGKVKTEVSAPQEVTLYAELSDGACSADFEIPVRLVPGKLTGEQERLKGFTRELRLRDEAQQEEGYLTLPREYDGRALRYRSEAEGGYEIILLLGILTAVLLSVKGRTAEREREKKREQELLLDYAEVVSKLMVFIGAGMTIRNAWERMVKDYEAGCGKGNQRPSAAYQEMQKTYYQLKNGMAEGEAYREFGRRCRLQPYLKLSSLLEQNRKAGTKNLRAILQTEMADAFEMRKNLARRMGEEAGTKLLLPLFLMLGIIMVMIMVPAMMTMG